MTVQEAVDSLKIIFGYYKRLMADVLSLSRISLNSFKYIARRIYGYIWYIDGFIRRVLLNNAISSYKYLICIKY